MVNTSRSAIALSFTVCLCMWKDFLPETFLQLPKRTKKEQGQIKFILMDGLGKSFIDKTVTDQELLVGIHAICR